MSQVSIDEIRDNTLEFLRRVEAGEDLIITQAGRAVAEIRPISPVPATPRPYGLCAGQFTVPDDFDQELPEEILKEFEGL